MKKERLTLQNIKQDLKNEVGQSYVPLILLFIVFVLFLYITSISEGLFAIGRVFWAFMTLLSFLFFVGKIFEMIYFHRLQKGDQNIVKATLVNKREKDDVHISRSFAHFDKIYYLSFQGYPEFRLGKKNHQWSEMFPLSDKGIYNYAEIGDEFYLVLSKSGKQILLVYNTKMFELCE